MPDLTAQEIQQARRWATWALDDDITKFPTEMQDAAEDLARAFLALTEQQPEPVTWVDLVRDIKIANQKGITRAAKIADMLAARYTITRKQGGTDV